MGIIKNSRTVPGKIVLWVFIAYCLFFVVELFRFYDGIKGIDSVAGYENATLAGFLAAGIIIFVPLLLIGLLLAFFTWLTRAKAGK